MSNYYFSVAVLFSEILVDNGYIEDNNYYFYVRDHLGNNRIVTDASGVEVVQSNEYYPFGMLMASSTNPDEQPYKYGDKELDTSFDLNWYDFSARYQDGIRFTTIDPLAEKKYWLSPYTYGRNNPLRFIDPDGMDEWEINPQGKIKWIENKEIDAFHLVNSDGNRIEGKSMTFKYGTVGYFNGSYDLPTTNGIQSSEYSVFHISGDETANNLYKFIADHTGGISESGHEIEGAEWSLSRFSDENKNINYLTTSHNDARDVGVTALTSTRYVDSNLELLEMSHSHPGLNYRIPSGLPDYPGRERYAYTGDMGIVRSRTERAISRKLGIPIFKIYLPELKKEIYYDINSKFSDFK